MHNHHHISSRPAPHPKLAPAPILNPHREAQREYREALEAQMKEKQGSKLGNSTNGNKPLFSNSNPPLLKFQEGRGWVPTKR
jgi:hypothetical protein